MKRLCLTILFLIMMVAPATAMEHSMARHVLEEINLARTDPHTYAGFLRTFRGHFKGKIYTLPGTSTRMQTNEGTRAVDEAIRILSRQKPLKALAWSDGLAVAASDLVEDQGRTGRTGHTGSQGNGMQERIEKHGTWERQIAENIGYGPDDARSMVMQLIIDDGVPDRGHRKNTYNSAFGVAGVACGPHPGFGSMCVIDFAGAFKE